MAIVTKLACDFCGKSEDQVKALISGPNVCICDECVHLCVDILAEHKPAAEPKQEAGA